MDFVVADVPQANRLTVDIMAMVADEERRGVLALCIDGGAPAGARPLDSCGRPELRCRPTHWLGSRLGRFTVALGVRGLGAGAANVSPDG